MSTPVNPAKSVKAITHSLNALRSAPTQFAPPPAPKSLSFTIPQLAGSIARAVALSQAAPRLVSVLTANSENLLNVLVDPIAGDLSFLGEVRNLADHMRTGFSGECGAGITDLYMMQLGYTLRCNGKEYLKAHPALALPHSRKVFDYVYEGSPTKGAGVVAAEAKGSIQDQCRAATLQNMVKDGYDNQVGLYVGKVLHGGTILHGYGVGIGARPNGTASFVHIEESGLPQPSGSAGDPDRVDFTAGSGSPPPRQLQNAGQPTFLVPDTRVTLGNYGAVFRLLEASNIDAAITAALDEQLSGIPKANSITLPIVEWRGNRYVTSASVLKAPSRKGSPPAFGLRADVAEAFLQGLTSLATNQSLPRFFPRELPIRPFDLAGEMARADGGAEFPDGLAYFGDLLGLSATPCGMVWDPPEGPRLSEGYRLVRLSVDDMKELQVKLWDDTRGSREYSGL